MEKLIWARRSYRFLLRDWLELKDLKLASEVMNTVRFSRNLKPLLLPPPAKKSILVIAPHPDDEILGPGGTLLQSIKAGSSIHVLYLTSGKASEHDIREREALAVSKECGYECLFLRANANSIELTKILVGRVASEIASLAPDIIMLPFLLDDNDDHRRANELLLRSLEQEMVPANVEIWAYQVYSALYPNVIVDITSVAVRKKKLIREFSSQMKDRKWDLFALGLNAWNIRFVSNHPDIESVESFFVAPINEYRDICLPYFEEPGQVYSNPLYATHMQTIVDGC
jgi:N-acetylglucosamine malate deacetylase 1